MKKWVKSRRCTWTRVQSILQHRAYQTTIGFFDSIIRPPPPRCVHITLSLKSRALLCIYIYIHQRAAIIIPCIAAGHKMLIRNYSALVHIDRKKRRQQQQHRRAKPRIQQRRRIINEKYFGSARNNSESCFLSLSLLPPPFPL